MAGVTGVAESDAGNDLFALEDFTLFKGQTRMVRTGVAISVPDHCYAQIASRSGLAKKSIFVTGGVIDVGFCGEVCVLLNNFSNEAVQFKKGDKIAQLIFLPIVEVSFKQVDALKPTRRGSKGFGSSDQPKT